MVGEDTRLHAPRQAVLERRRKKHRTWGTTAAN